MCTRAFLALAFNGVTSGVLFAQGQAPGSEVRSRIFDPDSASFWINVPRGWDLDTEAGLRDGMIGVLYRHGATWRTGDPVIYMRVITPDIGYNAVIAAAIRSDSANWGGAVRDFVFTTRDSVRAISGAFAQVRLFQSAATKRFDTAAYLQAEGRVWMLELAARSREAHDAALADFLSMVKSYAPGPDPPQH